jgi:hypothetical protein
MQRKARQESRARQEQREARTQEARALRHRVLRIPEAARQARRLIYSRAACWKIWHKSRTFSQFY